MMFVHEGSYETTDCHYLVLWRFGAFDLAPIIFDLHIFFCFLLIQNCYGYACGMAFWPS